MVFKCKMCGDNLRITDGAKIVECDSCGTFQTIPNLNSEKKINLFNRANRLRFVGEFDQAATIYENIIAEFPDEAEAYWGACLCKFGIEYVDDPRTAQKIPTCHRTSFESIFDDSNYSMAISCSTIAERAIYEREAKAIDVLQKNILSIVHKEEPFDVFICYKETDEYGNRTVDSVLAQDIYEHLTDRGFKVFFARITLEYKLGEEYEPYIFAALNSAKIMLVIGTSGEHFDAVWVKNEWSRFLALMRNDRSKMLIPCFRDVDPYDMPGEFKKLQSQDMSKLGFIQDLTRGITKIIRDTNDKHAITTVSPPTGALTKRGYFFLEDGDFSSADKYFDKALDENPEDGKAYAGKFLALLHKSSIDQICDIAINIDSFKDFDRAVRFSNGVDKLILEDIRDKVQRKYQLSCLAVGLSRVVALKEQCEIEEKLKILACKATVEAYDEIVAICEQSLKSGFMANYFTKKFLESAKLQRRIIQILADGEEHIFAEIRQICEGECSPTDAQYVKSFKINNAISQMIKDGSVENGSSINYYCIVGALEKRRLAQQKNDYERAENLMRQSADNEDYDGFFSAAEIFSSIESFQDASSKAIECRFLGEKYKEKFEAEKIWQERLLWEARMRQEAEWRAAEIKRLDEIRIHNNSINAQIYDLKQKYDTQQTLYWQNAGKIFGAGAKIKKSALNEMEKLEKMILNLKQQLK